MSEFKRVQGSLSFASNTGGVVTIGLDVAHCPDDLEGAGKYLGQEISRSLYGINADLLKEQTLALKTMDAEIAKLQAALSKALEASQPKPPPKAPAKPPAAKPATSSRRASPRS
jgi:hypothetical protein